MMKLHCVQIWFLKLLAGIPIAHSGTVELRSNVVAMRYLKGVHLHCCARKSVMNEH